MHRLQLSRPAVERGTVAYAKIVMQHYATGSGTESRGPPPPVRVLFVGNSFTYGPAEYNTSYRTAGLPAYSNGAGGETRLNNLPRMFALLAASLGRHVEVGEDTIGGCSLWLHRPSLNLDSVLLGGGSLPDLGRLEMMENARVPATSGCRISANITTVLDSYQCVPPVLPSSVRSLPSPFPRCLQGASPARPANVSARCFSATATSTASSPCDRTASRCYKGLCLRLLRKVCVCSPVAFRAPAARVRKWWTGSQPEAARSAGTGVVQYVPIPAMRQSQPQLPMLSDCCIGPQLQHQRRCRSCFAACSCLRP